MNMKKLSCIRSLLFLCMVLGTKAAAQPVHPPAPHPRPHRESMNYSGRKMPRHAESFSAIGVKIEDGSNDVIAISVFFNDILDTNSIRGDSILINGAELPPGTEFIFSKTRQMMRVSIPRTAAPHAAGSTFSLTLGGIRSFDGRAIKAEELHELSAGTFFKYSRKEQAWQKSSL